MSLRRAIYSSDLSGPNLRDFLEMIITGKGLPYQAYTHSPEQVACRVRTDRAMVLFLHLQLTVPELGNSVQRYLNQRPVVLRSKKDRTGILFYQDSIRSLSVVA